MSFLSSIRENLDAKNRGMIALSPIAMNACMLSVEPKKLKKQRYYISKLQQLSSQLVSSKDAAPNERPPPSTPHWIDEAANNKVNDNDIEEMRLNKLKEDRQIRCRNKLKALGQLLRENEALNNSNNSSYNDPSCVTLDIIRKRYPNNIAESTNGKSFQLPELCRCCNSVKMYVGDVFSVDDDIEQLLLQESLDDANLSDEWSLDGSSTPSEQTKLGTDVSSATDSCAQDEGSPSRPVQCEGSPRGRSSEQDELPRDRSLEREILLRHDSLRREGSPRTAVLFRGDPCEI
ncbi:hypothetical protein ACHAW6_009818 [Cyclotella cf. meneghiniana]